MCTCDIVHLLVDFNPGQNYVGRSCKIAMSQPSIIFQMKIQGSKFKMKSTCFWQLRTRNLDAQSDTSYVFNYVVNFELVANLATA